jgi:hypothetical protein
MCGEGRGGVGDALPALIGCAVSAAEPWMLAGLFGITGEKDIRPQSVDFPACNGCMVGVCIGKVGEHIGVAERPELLADGRRRGRALWGTASSIGRNLLLARPSSPGEQNDPY